MKNAFVLRLFSGLLLSSCLLFSSCDLFKSVPKDDTVYDEVPGEIKGGKAYDPTTGQEEDVDYIPTELDSINWKRNPNSDAPPIRSGGQNGSSENLPEIGENQGNSDNNSASQNGDQNSGNSYLPSTQKSTYEVAMMLPFVTNRFNNLDNQIYPKSEWAIQYYGGSKIAFDRLRSEGINLNINVLDTEGNESKVNQQVSNAQAIKKADLIIGPYRSVNVRQVAEYAKNRQIPVVSPYSAASRISNDNPFLIQVNPSLTVHIKKIMEHALSNNNPEDLVLVVRDKPEEKARLALLQDAYRKISKASDSLSLKEFIIDEENVEKMPIMENINKGGRTVYVVPTWSSEVFVNTFLRQVEIARTPYDQVTVYGMPQWMEYENVDYTYFEKLNLHISSNFFVNKNEFNAREFRKSFYDRYGKRPEEAAYLGYAVALYFGRQIHKGGTQFQQFLSENKATMIHTEFSFEPVFYPTPGNDATTPIERYENMYVHILKFDDYQWQKAQ